MRFMKLCRDSSNRYEDYMTWDSPKDVAFAFADVDDKLYAHKCILSINSRVFKSMFFPRSDSVTEVNVPGVRRASFELSLLFVYGTAIEVPDASVLFELYDIAKRYEFDELKSKTVRAIRSLVRFESTRPQELRFALKNMSKLHSDDIKSVLEPLDAVPDLDQLERKQNVRVTFYAYVADRLAILRDLKFDYRVNVIGVEVPAQRKSSRGGGSGAAYCEDVIVDLKRGPNRSIKQFSGNANYGGMVFVQMDDKEVGKEIEMVCVTFELDGDYPVVDAETAGHNDGNNGNLYLPIGLHLIKYDS